MWEICIREKEEMAVNPTHGKAAIWGICESMRKSL